MATEKINETPKTKISVESIAGLTDAQKTELRNAQREAIIATTGDKLAILKQNISPDTQKILSEKSVNLSDLIEEQGVVGRAIDKAKEIGGDLLDGAKNLQNQVEGVMKENPITGDTGKKIAQSKDVMIAAGMTWTEFFAHPIDSLGKLWDVLKQCFSAMSFDPLIEFFSPGEIIKKIYAGIDVIAKDLDLSSYIKESYRELFAEIKEMRELKLEDLMNLKGKKSSEIIAELKLPSSVSENDLKNFMESFFEDKNFAKIEEMAKSKGKMLQEIKQMKFSEIFSLIATQK